MSKSRTGRKGRVRAAVAAALGSLDASVTGNTIVDANGRAGTASGFLSSDGDKSSAQILDYIQGELNKAGSANAFFQQGDIRGPLLDSVDTQNGATGAISSADSGALAAATGETSAAAIAPLSTAGSGIFPHYIFENHAEAANLAAAVTAAAGGAMNTLVAATAQSSTTAKRGILYHNGGPGSNLVPSRDCGALGANVCSATSHIINPSLVDLHSDTGHVPVAATRMRLRITGRLASNGSGVAGENGDSLIVYKTDSNVAATTKFMFNGQGGDNDGVGHATSGGFPTGGEIVLRDQNGDVLVTIIGDINAGGVSTLVATDAGGAGNVQGKNFDATTTANTIYVISHASANGATSYPGGTGDLDSMGGFVDNLEKAINAWSVANGNKITAAAGTGTSDGALPDTRAELTITYNGLMGTAGNAPVNAAEGALTVTAYNSAGVVLSPAVVAASAEGSSHGSGWFCVADGTNSVPCAFRRFGADGGTAGSLDTSLASDAHVTLATLDADTDVDDITFQELPIRIAYVTDDGCRETLAPSIAGAAGAAVLDCVQMPDGTDRTLTFTIPTSMGGEGVTTILLDEDQTTSSVGETAHVISVGVHGDDATALQAKLILAINGGADADIDYATSGRGTGGILGVTASAGAGTNVNLALNGAGATVAGVTGCTVTVVETGGTTDVGAVACQFAAAGTGNSGAGFTVVWGPA